MITSVGFDNINKKEDSLPARVADQISQLIIDRQLKTGDKLPNELELATQLVVGRSTVREAIKLLVAKNVLEIRRGKGTFISDNTGVVEDPLGFVYYPDQFQLGMDLLELRLQLEPWVAAAAAERATEEDIALMEEKCFLVEQDILEKKEHLDHDVEFHISIANGTHNLVVPKLIPIITYSVKLIGSRNGTSLLTETIVRHRAILDAIKARDPQQAEKAMIHHLEQNHLNWHTTDRN